MTREPRAFISYATADRLFGAAIKAALTELNIASFLAHDDVRVSEAWERRILVELARCNVFVPLLSKHFVTSEWCAQECGYILKKRRVDIVPFSLDGTMPFGFLRKVQAKRIAKNEINETLFTQLLANRFPRHVLPQLIEGMNEIYTFRTAEAALADMQPYFADFTAAEAARFADLCVENGQIWAAHLCRDQYLPQFLRLRGNDIKRRTRQRLQFQITNQRWFPEKKAKS